MANPMIQFVSLTRAQYDALATKESRALYFISDTQELYRGAVSFSNAIVFHADGARPTAGALGKLYINQTTKEGTTYNGTAWQVVIPAVSQAVTTDTEKDGVAAPVSGAAVKAYVDAQASTTLAACITDVKYDADKKAITVTKDGKATDLPLTKLGAQLAYDATTGIVSLKDKDGTELSSVNIPLDNFVTGGAYNDTDKALELTLKNGNVIKIPAGDLVKLYHDLDSNTVDVTIATDATSGLNTIKADVKVSATAGNAIQIKDDGLYVPPSTTKMNKVGTGHDDEIITADATGDAKASGFKVGAATLNADATAQAKLVATEAAVAATKADIETAAGTTYVKLTDVITSAADINPDNPSTTKVISEKALVEAMSWQEL